MDKEDIARTLPALPTPPPPEKTLAWKVYADNLECIGGDAPTMRLALVELSSQRKGFRRQPLQVEVFSSCICKLEHSMVPKDLLDAALRILKMYEGFPRGYGNNKSKNLSIQGIY